MQYTAEILCLGNEMLIGRTTNTNANFLAKELTRIGFKVTRITTIRDELGTGARTVEEIVRRRPHVLCISGGLGPTHDDIQLKVVAEAIRRNLELNQEALEMVRASGREINDSVRKMAMLPKGSIPLHSPEGSAPGVLTRYDGTLIISLPGFPLSMKAMFTEEVLPRIVGQFEFDEVTHEYGIEVRGARESDIGSITERTMRDFEDIDFKSHPRRDDTGFYLALHTYAITADESRVREALEQWIRNIEMEFDLEILGEPGSVM